MKKLRIWDGTKMVCPNTLFYNVNLGLEARTVYDPDKGIYYFSGVPQQYTGLLDCDGVEIYEGDILEDIDKELFYEKGTRTEVFFYAGSFCGSFLYDLMPFSLFDCKREDNKLLKYKVVGNIFQI